LLKMVNKVHKPVHDMFNFHCAHF